MELASLTWAKFPKIVSTKKSKLCVYTSLYPSSSLPSSSSSLLLSSKRGNLVSRKHSASVICNSQLKVEEQDLDAEACELVNGTELKVGEGEDALHAYLFQAVKNNNGAGILLLSDVLGFQDSYTRDFSYRVACSGYNVLVPDLFRSNPWSKDRPQVQYEEWRANQDLNRVAEDIATATKWMVDEFMAEESSTKLGVIGFCFGGSRVLEVLARDHDSVFGTGVSFYGANIDSSVVRNVKVPVLLVAGDNDPLCPVDKLNEIGDTVGKSSKVVVFKGRGHGFVHRPESAEEDADAEEAFTIMRNWLHNKLLEKA